MRRVLLIALVTLGCGCRPDPRAKPTPDASPARAPAEAETTARRASEAVDPPGTFEGREIADTMSYLGAGWLTRPERDAEENTTLMHEQLGLEPGDVACDVGAGNGYHSLKMAAAVGPKGKVIASDLQPEMLELLEARAKEAGVSNLQTVQATDRDPMLPANTCDLILLVDVYHEFSYPEEVLAAMRRALSDDGRIALLEYRAEDPDVPIKPRHKMSKAQILEEYLPRGFVLVDQFDGLPWQHLMFFSRAAQ